MIAAVFGPWTIQCEMAGGEQMDVLRPGWRAAFRLTHKMLGLDWNVSGTYNLRFPQNVMAGTSPMPEIAADSPDPSCSHLHSEGEIHLSQPLGIDPCLLRAREGLGRIDARTRKSAALLLLIRLKSSG